MGQTATPDGTAHRDEMPVRQGSASSAPGGDTRSGRSSTPRPSGVSLVVGSLLCVVALLFLSAGAWAVWKDRVDRDGQGFVAFGTAHLRTAQHAIVGDLQGGGPSWFYGAAVLGDARIRAESAAEQTMFIGIARKDDVVGYLRGVGYATIESFQVRDDTTHLGGPPSHTPGGESIWVTSTQGTGRQTLLWTPQKGDWSVVFMNADASANVDIRGDVSAELPPLPWLAGLLVIIGASTAVGGVWVLVRALHHGNHPPQT